MQKLDKLAHLALSRFKYSKFCSPEIPHIRKEKGNVENGQRKSTAYQRTKTRTEQTSYGSHVGKRATEWLSEVLKRGMWTMSFRTSFKGGVRPEVAAGEVVLPGCDTAGMVSAFHR